MKVVVLVDRDGYKTVQESDVPKGYDYVIHSQDDVTVRCPRKDVKPLLDMFICQVFNKKVDEVLSDSLLEDQRSKYDEIHKRVEQLRNSEVKDND